MAETVDMTYRLKSILEDLDVVIILVAILVVVAIFKANTFYNLSNLFTILQLLAVLGIATLGEALVLQCHKMRSAGI